jgi:hypothetical protein
MDVAVRSSGVVAALLARVSPAYSTTGIHWPVNRTGAS